MDVTVDVRVDGGVDVRKIKPAGKCPAWTWSKKLAQSAFFIFSALGGQNARKIAGKTHMMWAHLN